MTEAFSPANTLPLESVIFQRAYQMFDLTTLPDAWTDFMLASQQIRASHHLSCSLRHTETHNLLIDLYELVHSSPAGKPKPVALSPTEHLTVSSLRDVLIAKREADILDAIHLGATYMHFAEENVPPKGWTCERMLETLHTVGRPIASLCALELEQRAIDQQVAKKNKTKAAFLHPVVQEKEKNRQKKSKQSLQPKFKRRVIDKEIALFRSHIEQITTEINDLKRQGRAFAQHKRFVMYTEDMAGECDPYALLSTMEITIGRIPEHRRRQIIVNLEPEMPQPKRERLKVKTAHP